MRIAVVGGGAAGLCSAWLLEGGGHDVVLFERSERLGGHVRTIDVELAPNRTATVEVGFRFFSRAGWPRFLTLLDHLGVEVEEYDQTLTFHDRADGWTMPLPPTGSWRRWSSILRPRTRRTLLEFKKVLDRAAPFIEDGDWETTVGQALDDWGIDEAGCRDFLLPYVASSWGVPVDEARGLSARNTWTYTCKNRPTGLASSTWLDARGGLETYVGRLTRRLNGTKIVTAGAGTVLRIDRRGNGTLSITTGSGAAGEFDRVVLACSAEAAAGVLPAAPGAAGLRDVLARFEYFDARVVVHRDRSLMPPRRDDWSCVQLIRDENECSIHEWCGRRQNADLFRSWVTHATRLPDPRSIVAGLDYRHAKPTPDYFAAQSALEAHQGRDGLWFAGLWTEGVDSHESALLSAVRVARALAPESKRLALFD